MSRRMARETAMKCCFAREFNEEAALATLPDTDDEELGEDSAYADEILRGVWENLDMLDEKIRGLAIGWEFGRMPRVDVCIMRVALYEMMFREDIPESVSINEAVEIAKKYSGEKSAPYINGMLGTFSRRGAKGEADGKTPIGEVAGGEVAVGEEGSQAQDASAGEA